MNFSVNSGWAWLNPDELLYIFHIWIGEPVWYVVSFGWIRDLGRANFGGEGEGGFLGTLARIIYSRPSATRDSVDEAFNPKADLSLWELLGQTFFGRGDQESIITLLFTTFFGWIILLALLLLLLFILIKLKSKYLDEKEKIIYDTVISKQQQEVASDKSARWEKISNLVNSEDPSSWKLSVIDADILLADVLDDYGFSGATVSDQLKSAEKSGLTTLQYAWEAHKTRNKIAHDPMFSLGKREALTTISFYEKFFAELYHL